MEIMTEFGGISRHCVLAQIVLPPNSGFGVRKNTELTYEVILLLGGF